MSKPHLLIMKAFIIDDSEIDRLNLRILLEDYPEIGVIAEAHSLKSARQLLSKQQPDLIFLDIHLGKEKGFDLLDTINDHVQVIITTSHPQYVLKDFGSSCILCPRFLHL